MEDWVCLFMYSRVWRRGFKGYWTLEIFCVEPIRIYSGVEICQIYYHDVGGDYEKYSSGKYQNNKGIQPSLLYKDFIN